MAFVAGGVNMKATWNGQVIAESNATLQIEGNEYFPRESVKSEFMQDSQTHTTCPWKGEASYYTLAVDDKTNTDAAWYYSVPKEGSVERVGHDFANYVAFWKGVEVSV